MKAALWHIDFMDDSAEYAAVLIDHPYAPDEAIALPGYLADVARDVLDEGGWTQ